jgi:hypothetical protein
MTQFNLNEKLSLGWDEKFNVLDEKLNDALTPGFEAECDPQEAEEAGAFKEDALSEQDAIDSAIDLSDALQQEVQEEDEYYGK